MKVTARTSISFPKLHWAISAGETKDLPESKEAQERILAHEDITLIETTIKVKEETK